MKAQLTTLALALFLPVIGHTQSTTQDPLVTFVNACVFPKLEGNTVDYNLLSKSYNAVPSKGEAPTVKKFNATYEGREYSLEIENDRHCRVKYSVPNELPIGQDFGKALGALMTHYYKGQMGTPSTDSSGVVAFSMSNDGKNIRTTVAYTFSTDGSMRNLFVYTTVE